MRALQRLRVAAVVCGLSPWYPVPARADSIALTSGSFEYRGLDISGFGGSLHLLGFALEEPPNPGVVGPECCLQGRGVC
jgi:hypothetical protein